MDVPIRNLLSIVNETDLYHTWMPFCKLSNTIHKISRTKQIILNQFKVPFPFISTRENLWFGHGINALKTPEKCLMAIGHSVSGEAFKEYPLPPPGKGVVRPDVNVVMLMVEPLPEGKVRFRVISNFDPKLKAVPYWLLNWFSRKFAKTLFKRVEKKAKNLIGTIYE